MLYDPSLVAATTNLDINALPPRIVMAGVLLLAALLYLPTLGFGFVYDDHWTLLANGFLRCPEDLGKLLGRDAHAAHVPDAFRPTAVVFDMLTYQLLGAHAHWHHLLSIVLHVAVCAGLWRWLAARGLAPAMVATTVAVFATMAIHAETVSVVSYREDLLAAGLGLEALIWADRAATTSTRGWPWLVVVALQALACGAKSNALVLPLLWAVSWICGPWSRGSRPNAKSRVLGFAALGLGSALALAHQIHIVGALGPYDAQVGIHAAAWPRSAVLAQSVQIHVGYVQQMIAPVGLSPEYVDRPGTWTDAAPLLGAGGLALALVHALGTLSRRSTWTFVVLATLILWLPTANLVPMPNMRADRFAYLPSIAACIGIGAVLVSAGTWLAQRSGRAALAIAPAVAFVVFQGALAQATATAYKSDGRLWEVALRRAPDSARAHALLGEIVVANLRGEEGQFDPVLYARASAHCLRALALAPTDALPHLCAARLALLGKHWSRAHRHFETALGFARAREDRIITALASVTLDVPEIPYPERIQRVDDLLSRAVRDFPYASEVAATAGRLEHRLGRADRAFHLYRRARKLRPERWDVVFWGLELALDLGDSSAAWIIWRGARDLLPDADPKWVDATRRRVYDGLRSFPHGSYPRVRGRDLPLTDLAPESSADDP